MLNNALSKYANFPVKTNPTPEEMVNSSSLPASQTNDSERGRGGPRICIEESPEKPQTDHPVK